VDVVDLHAPAAGVCATAIEEQRCRVQPGHPSTHAGEPVGDAAMTAGQVQDLGTGTEGEKVPHRRRFVVGRVIGESRGVEVQIVLVEQLVDRPLLVHWPML
jgi:hypothetical protein